MADLGNDENWKNGLALKIIVNHQDQVIWLILGFLRSSTLKMLESARRAVGCVVKVSARGSEGRQFDTRLHQLSD